MPKHTARSATRSTPSAAPRASAADRRMRHRLRDLCDEVIASYRVARGATPLSDAERAEAHAILAHVAPAVHG